MRARLAVGLWAACAILLLFAAAMTRTVTYDEDQYLAAAALTRHLMPYRDFAYLQAPLYPLVLAPLLALCDGWVLLTARLLTFVLSVGSAVLLWRLVRRLGAGTPLAVLLLTACLASPFLAAPVANSRNDIMPVFLLLAGLAVHLWSAERSWWGRAAAALLFGLAAEAKVSYAFAPFVLGCHALFAPARRLPPVLLGTAVAAAPALFFWWQAPESFRFGLLDYHLAAPADWYAQQGQADLLLPWAKLAALGGWAVLGGNLTLIVLCVALALVVTARHRKWKRPGPLLVGLLAAAAVLAFQPSPAWAMYYAAIPPLLACCAAHLDRVTLNVASTRRKRALMILAALPTLVMLPIQARELPRLLDPSQWVGLAAHRSALAVRAALPAGGPVATLFPHAVLDANPIRPDLAAGPFLFRTGALLPEARLARLHAMSSATAPDLLGRTPPAAVLTGLYPDAWAVPMDQVLTGWATARGWRVAMTGPQGERLFVPP